MASRTMLSRRAIVAVAVLTAGIGPFAGTKQARAADAATVLTVSSDSGL
jgi:hypothetical protein